MQLIVRQRPAAGHAAASPAAAAAADAASAGAPQPLSIEPAGDGYDVAIGERRYHVEVARLRDGVYSLRLGGMQHEVAVERRDDGSFRVSAAHGATLVEVADPLTHLAAQAAGGGSARRRQLVTAYMPGRVVALLVAAGEAVKAGQGVLVLEAMKMQNEIQAEHDGTVVRILVETGQAVDGGQPLFELE